MGIQACLNRLFSFTLDIYLEVELLDHTVVLFLIFWGTAKLFSIVAAPICVPRVHKVFFFSPHLQKKDTYLIFLKISSVQSLSHVQLFVTPWSAELQASLSVTNSQSLLKLTSIKSMIPSNHLIICCSLLLLPSVFPSIRVFPNELVLCIRWPKYWSFSFSISPSNEYSWLISFGIEGFDLTVQGNLKTLLQHHSSKASILQCSAFIMI